MGSPIKFGDRLFKAQAQRKELQQPEAIKRQVRYVTANDAEPLIAPGNTVILSHTFTISSNTKLINIIDLIAYVNFVDNGVGTYNVSDLIALYVNTDQFGNLDPSSTTFPYLSKQAQAGPYNILGNLNNANQITVTGIVYGADVARLTGITPGAADSLSSIITLVYEPL